MAFSKVRDPIRQFAWSAADQKEKNTFEMAALIMAPLNLHQEGSMVSDRLQRRLRYGLVQ